MKMGKIVPGAKIEIVKETPTTAIVDGHLKFGQMVGFFMADLVMKKAKEYGMGCAVSLNAAHAGRVGSYTEYIAKPGLLAFCTVSLCYDKPLARGARRSPAWARTRSPGRSPQRAPSRSSWTAP